MFLGIIPFLLPVTSGRLFERGRARPVIFAGFRTASPDGSRGFIRRRPCMSARGRAWDATVISRLPPPKFCFIYVSCVWPLAPCFSHVRARRHRFLALLPLMRRHSPLRGDTRSPLRGDTCSPAQRAHTARLSPVCPPRRAQKKNARRDCGRSFVGRF